LQIITIIQILLSLFLGERYFYSKEKDDVIIFYGWLSIAVQFVLITIFLTLLNFYLNYNWFFYLNQFFRYFQLSGEMLTSVNSIIYGNGPSDFSIFLPFVSIISILLIYFSFFTYLKKTGASALDGEKNESVYTNFCWSLIAFLNHIILPIWIIYLVLIKNDVFQAIIFFYFFIFTTFCFVDLLHIYTKIVSTHSDLLQINEELPKIKNFDNPKLTYISNIKTIQKTTYVLHSLLFAFTLVIFFLTILSGFNILTTVYLVLCVIAWYHIFSIVCKIPSHTVNITLVTDVTVNDVFIMEESPKGFFIVIKPDNTQEKIFTTSILHMEPNSNKKTVNSDQEKALVL